MKVYDIKKTLVPIDFSPLSDSALSTAVGICKRNSSRVTLLHIVESAFGLLAPKAGIAASSLVPELVQSAEERLRVRCAEIITLGVHANYAVVVGNPANEINRWSSEEDIDLVVMGTHGANGIREFLLGTNAYRVVKNSICPVLTVPATTPWVDFKKILFPVRLVPKTLEKYDVLKPFINRNGSSVQISGIVEYKDKPGVAKMNELVSQLKTKMQLDNVICGAVVHICENAARQVLEIASNEEPDLIVITATVDSSLKEFFLNPYTQDIVNHSRFPVLSIRPGDPAETSAADQLIANVNFSLS